MFVKEFAPVKTSLLGCLWQSSLKIDRVGFSVDYSHKLVKTGILALKQGLWHSLCYGNLVKENQNPQLANHCNMELLCQTSAKISLLMSVYLFSKLSKHMDIIYSNLSLV